MTLLAFIVVCLCVAIGASENINYIILPPNPLPPEAPTCTSYSGLCHLAYNLTDNGNSYQVYHSEQEICRCPGGKQCETDWSKSSSSMTRTFTNGGQEVEVKISYCKLRQPDTICRINEPALVTRGRGAFTFEIVSDFSCRCYRPLFAHRSWREGDYDYIEYACGKPRCGMNRLPSSECTTITWNGAPDMLNHTYVCRCRRGEECTSGLLPTAEKTTVVRSCERVPTSTTIERRRRRSILRKLGSGDNAYP
ncbi:uncharacterized protein LOC127839468 [Dreissena polymorpha]|uniref:Uncharacterized protein n=1 Tax=Dreissena polymorpha TaxID=45954 RepID=A0A9D4F405_DREPO|nr:uncharacterized protein LOC127839468 [Dreissena polymorpha]KAH3791382.1 hypothetical protein DPMN_144867 [Dreissena polymorpha]